MSDEIRYAKLKDLVGSTITIKHVELPVYKMWSEGDKRFVTSATPQEGFSKKYPTDTDKGRLDLGAGQIGALLGAVLQNGKADIIGQTFEIKSNGKSGMDIRYFFNSVSEPKPVENDTISLDEIL